MNGPIVYQLWHWWHWLTYGDNSPNAVALQAMTSAIAAVAAIVAAIYAIHTFNGTREQLKLARDQHEIAKQQWEAERARLATENAEKQRIKEERYRRRRAEEKAKRPRFHNAGGWPVAGNVPAVLVNDGDIAAYDMKIFQGNDVSLIGVLQPGKFAKFTAIIPIIRQEGMDIYFKTEYATNWGLRYRLQGADLIETVILEEPLEERMEEED